LDQLRIKEKYIYCLIIIILLFYFVFQLNFYRHWSSTYDQDLILIHNSLLLNSGIKAEYHDHPGHTQILLMSIWLNFLDLINVINASSYDKLNNLNNLEKNFIDLVKFSRFFNLISSIIILYAVYNIIKLFYENKGNIYLGIILFICSSPFINSIKHIRTELMSSGFIFLTLLYILKAIKKNNLCRKYLILTGFFFTLSVFCKFQSVFIFIVFPLLFSIFEKCKKFIVLNEFEVKKLHIYLSIIIIIFISAIWFKYVKGLNYIILPIFVLFFYFFLNYLNKRFYNNEKFTFIFIFYFVLGISISFIILFILKPFHTNNINMIVNLLGASSMFVKSTNPYSFDIPNIFDLFVTSYQNLFFYLKNIYFFTKFNEVILLILFSIYAILNYKNNYITVEYLKILIILLFIISIFSVRPVLNYVVYFSPFLTIYFFNVLKNFNRKYIFSFLIFFIFFNFFHQNNIVIKKKIKFDTNKICNEKLNEKSFFTEKMRTDIFLRICK